MPFVSLSFFDRVRWSYNARSHSTATCQVINFTSLKYSSQKSYTMDYSEGAVVGFITV